MEVERLRAELSALKYGVANIVIKSRSHENDDSYDRNGYITYLLLCKKIIPKCSDLKQQ